MTGLDAIATLRRQRVRPRSVFVDLERPSTVRLPTWWPAEELDPGLLHVTIAPGDALADIDFRPLTGLFVQVCDYTDNPRRFRKVAAMIALVAPKVLVMPVWDGDTLVVHQRFAATPDAPVRTTTFRVDPS